MGASGRYSGVESDAHPVSDARQADQLRAAVELAYCQPAVGAFFNFELRDDADLARLAVGRPSARLERKTLVRGLFAQRSAPRGTDRSLCK